jgi:hypothetical protein
LVVADTITSQGLAMPKFEPRSLSLKPLTSLRHIARVLSLHINQEITIGQRQDILQAVNLHKIAANTGGRAEMGLVT